MDSPVLQKMDMELREVTGLAQGHTAVKWQGWIRTQVSLTLGSERVTATSDVRCVLTA